MKSRQSLSKVFYVLNRFSKTEFLFAFHQVTNILFRSLREGFRPEAESFLKKYLLSKLKPNLCLSAVEESSVRDNFSVRKLQQTFAFDSKEGILWLRMADPHGIQSQSGNGCSGAEKEKVIVGQKLNDNSAEGAQAIACFKSDANTEHSMDLTCPKQSSDKVIPTTSTCLGPDPEQLADSNTDSDKKKSQAASSKAPTEPPQLSKRAQKKLLLKQKLKEQRKAKKAANFTNNSSPGFDSDLFTLSDYYFENGLRKVYPYPFTFSTYAKERWYGCTLQDIFEREFRVDSPDNFRTQLAKGLMRVNGKTATPDQRIKNGDLIEHDIHRHENPVTGTPIEILEDTDEVLVINKPASIPCHPCGKFRFNSIVFIMGKEMGYANLRNIYRLDRLTSGVLIMGKTARKTKQLENQVLHRHVRKEYLARVVGEFPAEEVTVDRPLDCLSHKLTFWRVVDKGGKPSRTTFQRLNFNGKTSLVKCIPHTGRTHQIRVHLQYLGHPIINDPYYNSPAWGPQRGKGGNCDVSLEELCQRIMKDHNVGLWCNGENPLFHQRLAEVQGSRSNNEANAREAGCDETSAPKLTGHDLGNAQTGSPKKKESPPAKKPRLHSSPITAEGAVAEEGAHLSPAHLAPRDVPTPHSSTVISEGSACVDSTSESLTPCASDACDTVTSVKPETDTACTVEQSEGVSLKDRTPVLGKEGSESGVEGQGKEGGAGERRSQVGVERKGFDRERWIPDPNCESCRLKYIDPKPSDLLLYLHALRYEGPGWEYSTKPPEWAADDWQDPEDYDKYF